MSFVSFVTEVSGIGPSSVFITVIDIYSSLLKRTRWNSNVGFSIQLKRIFLSAPKRYLKSGDGSGNEVEWDEERGIWKLVPMSVHAHKWHLEQPRFHSCFWRPEPLISSSRAAGKRKDVLHWPFWKLFVSESRKRSVTRVSFYNLPSISQACFEINVNLKNGLLKKESVYAKTWDVLSSQFY